MVETQCCCCLRLHGCAWNSLLHVVSCDSGNAVLRPLLWSFPRPRLASLVCSVFLNPVFGLCLVFLLVSFLFGLLSNSFPFSRHRLVSFLGRTLLAAALVPLIC